MSPIASPPSASITATSTSTWPRSWTGAKERRAVALESSLVRPARSASILTAMLPAWATTPLPSADTDNPVDHVVCFTCEVPLSLGHLNSRQVQVSLTRQALSRIQAQCQVTTRERSGLTTETYLSRAPWARVSGQATVFRWSPASQNVPTSTTRWPPTSRAITVSSRPGHRRSASR
jgi:hypothetical protein